MKDAVIGVRIILKIGFRLILFAFLTMVTQIGGIAYLLSLVLTKIWKSNSKLTFLIFPCLYIIFTFLIVPLIAPLFGRERVKNTNRIKPANYISILLNRNYVKPELNRLLAGTEKKLEETSIEIHYLDANFPFINGFPLFPHLSHNDGAKIDLSLIYESKTGQISQEQKSVSGYGVFEGPKLNEFDQITKCLSNGYFQYDFTKYATFGSINNDLVFSEKGTKTLVESLLRSHSLGKLFIEPHLKQRLNLIDNRVRYHGCQAVRHDDHIHVQL